MGVLTHCPPVATNSLTTDLRLGFPLSSPPLYSRDFSRGFMTILWKEHPFLLGFLENSGVSLLSCKHQFLGFFFFLFPFLVSCANGFLMVVLLSGHVYLVGCWYLFYFNIHIYVLKCSLALDIKDFMLRFLSAGESYQKLNLFRFYFFLVFDLIRSELWKSCLFDFYCLFVHMY